MTDMRDLPDLTAVPPNLRLVAFLEPPNQKDALLPCNINPQLLQGRGVLAAKIMTVDGVLSLNFIMSDGSQLPVSLAPLIAALGSTGGGTNPGTGGGTTTNNNGGTGLPLSDDATGQTLIDDATGLPLEDR